MNEDSRYLQHTFSKLIPGILESVWDKRGRVSWIVCVEFRSQCRLGEESRAEWSGCEGVVECKIRVVAVNKVGDVK